MSYVVGDHEFDDVEDYCAACRDLKKIKSLEKTGKSTIEIARNYKKQISSKGMTFESCIGSDFIKELDRQTFTQQRSETGEHISYKYVTSKKRNVIKKIYLITLIFLFCLVGTILFLWLRMEKISSANMEELRAMIGPTEAPSLNSDINGIKDNEAPANDQAGESEVLPQYKELAAKNPDLAGWLMIPGTDIDYPVMYVGDNNDFYLNHDFERNDDVNGLLVLDKRCSPDETETNYLIHGHNMRSGAMFGELDEFVNEEYYRQHRYIDFDTLYDEKTFEIFAVFRSSVYDVDSEDFNFYDYIRIDGEKAFNDYVTGAKESSLYDTGVVPVYGDTLITLSTCEYTKKNGRLVVVGRSINEQDE